MRFRSLVPLCALLALPAIAAAADPGRLQLPDFSGLAKKATQSVDISLGPSLLNLAGGMINSDHDRNDAAVHDLIKGLRGIYVRSYTFDRPGEFSKAQVRQVEDQLLTPDWVPVVSTHDLKEGSNVDIYLRREGNRTDGVAIIAVEPRELTIVNIVGSIDLAKLAQLQGQFGVPRMGMTASGGAAPAAATAQAH